MPEAEVCVVIPTRGRETRLAFALEALAGQTFGSSRLEAVVVRDADAEPPLADAPEGLVVRDLVAPAGAGPGVKRNVGWRSTSAATVAFTDDDCRPAPDWIERIVAAMADPGVFAQGRTEVDPDERHLLFGLARSREIEGPSPWYEACNIAYPRSLLERLGGFDEAFSFGGEDTDLALRAIEAGARRAYAGDAVVWHAVLPMPLPAAVRDAVAWKTWPLVIARHRRLRGELFLGAFRNRVHASVLLAVAGVAAGHRRPAIAAAAALPYAAVAVDWRGARSARAVARNLVHLPARVLVDLAQVAGTARGAVRHRVAVL